MIVAVFAPELEGVLGIERPEDAELVALRISHDYPGRFVGLTDIHPTSAERLRSGNLRRLVRRTKVNMDAVLDLFLLGNPQEQ